MYVRLLEKTGCLLKISTDPWSSLRDVSYVYVLYKDLPTKPSVPLVRMCCFLLLGLLKVLEHFFLIRLSFAHGLLGGVRYVYFPRCQMNQLNKIDAGDFIINFCFITFDRSRSHFIRPIRLPNYLNLLLLCGKKNIDFILSGLMIGGMEKCLLAQILKNINYI